MEVLLTEETIKAFVEQVQRTLTNKIEKCKADIIPQKDTVELIVMDGGKENLTHSGETLIASNNVRKATCNKLVEEKRLITEFFSKNTLRVTGNKEIQVGNIVLFKINESPVPTHVVLLPGGSGIQGTIGTIKVGIIDTTSDIGKGLLGKKVGEKFTSGKYPDTITRTILEIL